jgi:hypothetical protein
VPGFRTNRRYVQVGRWLGRVASLATEEALQRQLLVGFQSRSSRSIGRAGAVGACAGDGDGGAKIPALLNDSVTGPVHASISVGSRAAAAGALPGGIEAGR